jgi:hypothetical protein
VKIDYKFIDDATIRVTMTHGTDTCTRDIDLTQGGELVSIPASRHAKDKAVIEAAFEWARTNSCVLGTNNLDNLYSAIKNHPDYKEEE